MFNAEQPSNAPAEEKKAPPDQAEAALEQKKREVADVAQDTAGIDATPLSDRKQPHEAPRPGEEDISGSQLLRGTNENVLNIAKRNMRSEKEYGDLNEITVDNTQFILTKDADGALCIRVNVYGRSSGELINQTVAVEKKDQAGALAYLNPPVPKEEEQFMDQVRDKLA